MQLGLIHGTWNSQKNPLEILFSFSERYQYYLSKAFEDGVHRSGSSLGLSGHGKRLQSSSRSLRWTRMPSSGQTQSLPSHFALNISCFPFNTSAFFQLPSVTAELCTGKSWAPTSTVVLLEEGYQEKSPRIANTECAPRGTESLKPGQCHTGMQFIAKLINLIHSQSI